MTEYENGKRDATIAAIQGGFAALKIDNDKAHEEIWRSIEGLRNKILPAAGVVGALILLMTVFGPKIAEVIFH